MTNLTTQQLEAIRKRAEAATGMQWTHYDEDGDETSSVYEYDRLTK